MASAVDSPRAARTAQAMGRGRRWGVTASVITLGTFVAWTAAPAVGAPDAQAGGGRGADGSHIYLPKLDRHPDPATPGTFVDVPCGTSGDVCLPPGWRVRCGGMGRVRDLVVVRSDVRGDGAIAAAPFAAVLAVGDGAAVGVPDGEGIAWRVATGVELVGLNQATFGSDLDGWAVGDSNRIAQLASGESPCWSIAFAGGPTQTLRSLELKPGGVPPFGDPWPPGIGGWAVGSMETVTRTVAMIAQLDVNQQRPLWRHLTMDEAGHLVLPPLYDVQSVPTADGGQQLWAIGQDGATGMLAQMQHIGRQWTWRRDEASTLDGYPTELALRSDKAGWAFGQSLDPLPTAALWRFENGRWQRRPRIIHPGQALIDAYVVDLSTIVYGLTPSALSAAPAARDAVRRAVGNGEWTTVAEWPAAAPLPPAEGHRALAPLGADRHLYALGDSLWLVDAGGGSPAASGWTRLWQRHDVHDVAGGPETGWALADVMAPDGPHLLAVDGVGLRRWQPEAPLPRLRALAVSGATYWAVGDGGATWWLPAGETSWRPAPADRSTYGGDLLAVATTPGGAVWAAGVDRDGRGRVWRMAAGRWQAIEGLVAPVPLTAIAATDRGNAWASGSTGAGAVLFIRPAASGQRPCPSADPYFGPWSRHDDVCSLTIPFRGTDVTTTGDDTLWLAREFDLVEVGLSVNRFHDLGVRGPEGDCPTVAASDRCPLRHGCRFTAIAAAHPNAVWAAAVCTAPGDPGRGATRLFHWDGTAWHTVTVLNAPIRRLVAGTIGGGVDDGAPWVWAAGDWTTVVQFAAQ